MPTGASVSIALILITTVHALRAHELTFRLPETCTTINAILGQGHCTVDQADAEGRLVRSHCRPLRLCWNYLCVLHLCRI